MTLPFRAVISDLDGTLLNREHRLGELTIKTLKQLADLGVDIFFATGRSFADVQPLVRDIKLDNARLVTSNGARACDLDGQQKMQQTLPAELALAIMQQTPYDPQVVCLNSYQGDRWFINKDIPQLRAYHQASGFFYQVVDFAQHHGEETEKIFYIGKQPSDLVPIEQFVHQHFGDQVHTAYSSPQCFEVMRKGVCKANALQQLVQQAGYTLADCIAFGDGMNDLEMLAEVGKGCLMANADPRLKQALPQHEVIGFHHEEAVAQELRRCFALT